MDILLLPELVLDNLAVQNPRANLNIAHDDLRTPRVDEVLLLLEREVITDVALFTQMSGKFSRYMFEADDRNLIWDSDGSATIGSRFGDPINIYGRLRTPSLAQRDYYQWDLGIRKIQSRRWFMQATYTYTNAVGSSSQAVSGSFIVDPRTRWNYGNLNIASRHQFKAIGSWDLPTDPWTQSITFGMRYFSGFPLERIYWSEYQNGGYSLRIRPRGTYTRFNPFWDLSIGFQQSIDVRRGQLQFQVQAENITNNRAPDVASFSALAQQNRLLANSRQDPLRVQLGVRYVF